MMTIALFGATGKTGSILLKKLNAKGYPVQALVRNPAKMTYTHNHLTVIQGDVLNKQCIYKVLKGCDAVINVIGHVKGCPHNLQTIASRNILEGMKHYGIKRLINLTGGGVLINDDNPGMFDKLVAFAMQHLLGKSIRNRFVDGVVHARLISKSDLDWTIVRAPVLLPGKGKGRTNIGMVGKIPGYSLKFEDLTDQIITILEDKSFIHKFPYITNG